MSEDKKKEVKKEEPKKKVAEPKKKVEKKEGKEVYLGKCTETGKDLYKKI